jgi:circadian clock protein KaiB
MNQHVSGKGSGEAVHLRLYVAGNAPNSMAARTNLAALLASCDPDTYVLEIIDCLVEPARTLRDGIVVTPTLLKLDSPRATVIGTLSDRNNLRSVIGLGDE